MGYWSIASQAYASWPLQDSAATTSIVAEVGPAATIAGGKNAAGMTAAGPRDWLPKALVFDGIVDRVSLANDFPTLAGWSLEAWVRCESTHSGTLIELRQDNSARLGTGLDGTLIGALNDGTNWHVINQPVAAGEWHHGVVVWDQSFLLLYLDGVAVGTPAAVALQNTNYNDPDEIGRAGWGASLFDGSLAGVRVHPALSATEVAELYAGPEPTVVVPPSFSEPVVVGKTIVVPTGGWNSNGNGSLSYQTVIQESPDGVGEWQDVAGSAGVGSFVVPSALEEAFVRVSARATNDGGESETVLSDPQKVFPISYPFSAVAAGTALSGATVAQAEPTARTVAGTVFQG